MSPKIMVVEDEPSAMRFMTHVLQKGGFEIIQANNGLEGLKKAFSEKPDLIVLDVMLPGMDGFNVCNRLTSDPITRNIPIIILSAKARDSDEAEAIHSGADLFLAKPVSPSDILSHIDKLLGATAGT